MTSDRKPPPETPASRSPGIPAGRQATRRSDDPIAMGLRRLWADVESEAVPDDFLNLLDQIDSRRAESGSEPSAKDGTGDRSAESGA